MEEARLHSNTVDEIARWALPRGTKLLTGDIGLGREVSWVVAQRSSVPLFPDLKGGEMALVSMPVLAQAQSGLSLTQLVRQLAGKGVSAIGIVGAVDEEVIKLANNLSLPLLSLPEGTSLRELEISVSRALSEQQANARRVSDEMRRRFTKAAMAGGGIESIVTTLAEETGAEVLFLDPSMRVVMVACPSTQSAAQELDPIRASATLGESPPMQGAIREPSSSDFAPGNTVQWLIDRVVGPQSERGGVLRIQVPCSARTCLMSKIEIQGTTRGYLCVLGTFGPQSPMPFDSIWEATAVSVLELAKQDAVAAVESRYKGDFLTMLLSGEPGSADDVVERGKTVGYDPSLSYLVSVVRSLDAQGAMSFLPILERDLASGRNACILGKKDDLVVLLCPLNDGRDVRDALGDLERVTNDLPVSTGVGSPRMGVEGIVASYDEAKRALWAAEEIRGGYCTVYHGDLGEYLPLMLLKDTPELLQFREETLGKLAKYDKHGAELIVTLEALFAHNGSLTETARSLHLHRNSLSYRLRRIEQIVELNLNNLEHVFRLQLALKALKLQGAKGLLLQSEARTSLSGNRPPSSRPRRKA